MPNAAKIKRLGRNHQEAGFQASSVKEELQHALEIMFSKPYLLQSVFGRQALPKLTQVWHSPAAFPNLPCSTKEACRFYSASNEEGDEQ
jgi:hypothetical protein